MDTYLNRREFAKRGASGARLAVAGSLLGTGELIGREQDRSGTRLVLLGLNALARAHELDYFADGHRGAAFVAAHLLCVENNLTPDATERIEQLFDLNWSSTDLCRPFPNSEPDLDRVAEIGEALVEGGEVLRQVGHNAIFAMLAIKAFRMLPSAATLERVEGVCRLIRAFTPWRDVEPDPAIDPPPFVDSVAASKFVVREASAAIDRFVGFGQGYAGHMLTLGQSLIELAAMGDVALAESCRAAFCKYVTVTRLGPNGNSRRIADHKVKQLRPNQYEYWKKRGDRALGIGHVFNYPYSYYDLMRRAGDSQLRQEFEAKAYAIF